MRCLFCCSVSVQETKIKPLEISPEANLETFGRVKKGGATTSSKKHSVSGRNDSIKNHLPREKLTLNQQRQQAFKERGKNATIVRGSIPNRKVVQKQEIAIQAGSPLSKTRQTKTRTTLSFSNEDVSKASTNYKNPFGNSPNNNDINNNNKGQGAKMTLNPLKKDLLAKRMNNGNQKKGDITLDPIDTSIPKKLVPVDKDFLKRLEKATSQANKDDTSSISRNKPEVKRIKTLLGGTTKHNGKNAPVLIKKRSNTSKRINNKNNANQNAIHNINNVTNSNGTQKSSAQQIQHQESGDGNIPLKELFRSHDSSYHSQHKDSSYHSQHQDSSYHSQHQDSCDNLTVERNKGQSDDDIYDSDDLDLMDQIEKEFANIL